MKKKISGLLILWMVCCIWFFFHYMEGFYPAEIKNPLSFRPDWEVLPSEVEAEVFQALSQDYFYLGKGCQSYVFASRDGQYVIKFPKYKHFRLPFWLEILPSFPYKEKKKRQKTENWNVLIQGWKLAYEHLKKETGVIFVHPNPSKNLQTTLFLEDKVGWKHPVFLDDMQFCIQKRLTPLKDVFLDLKEKKDEFSAKQLISRLIALFLSEYERGIAEKDYALLQNTGVDEEGNPAHMDFGDFVQDEKVKNREVMDQEIFSQMDGLKTWLMDEDPVLANYLENELSSLIGSSYHQMRPHFVSRIHRNPL